MISECNPDHPRWPELTAFFDQHKDGLAETIDGYDQRDSRMLIALEEDKIVGVLRLIVIPIGPDDGLPAVMLGDQELLQAKIMNFFVLPEYRRKGFGQRLQQAAIDLARSLDCYQLSSFSYSQYAANHALKLCMGFAVRPEQRSNGEAHGLYFIMPLQNFTPQDS